MSPAFFKHYAERLIDCGYSAFPIPPHKKTTYWSGWQDWCHTPPLPDQIARWTQKYPDWSVAIACGYGIVAVDIDKENPTVAYQVEQMTRLFLGDTPLMRIGQEPKRLLLYATGVGEIATAHRPGLDILGDGSYFVAYGIHPSTKAQYFWGDDCPATEIQSRLPHVSKAQMDRFLTALDAFEGVAADEENHEQRRQPIRPFVRAPWVTDASGRVTDGRDLFLAVCISEAYRAGATTDSDLARSAWHLFQLRASLVRNKRSGRTPWGPKDALSKARAFLRRAARGAVPLVSSQIKAGDGVFWTDDLLARFQAAVWQACSYGRLKPAAARVSDRMLGLVRGGGGCFVTVEHLAQDCELNIDTVKKARQSLRNTGFWNVEVIEEPPRTIHLYRPNVGALAEVLQPANTPPLTPPAGTPKPEEDGSWADFIASKT